MIIVGVAREEDRWDLDRAGGQHAQKGEMGKEAKKKKIKNQKLLDRVHR